MARKIAFASFVTLTLSAGPLQELQLSQVVQMVAFTKVIKHIFTQTDYYRNGNQSWTAICVTPHFVVPAFQWAVQFNTYEPAHPVHYKARYIQQVPHHVQLVLPPDNRTPCYAAWIM